MVTGSGKSNQTQTMDVINTESCMPTKMLIESIAIPAYSLTLSGLRSIFSLVATALIKC